MKPPYGQGFLGLFVHKDYKTWQEESCKLQRSFAAFIMRFSEKERERASEDVYAAVKQFDTLLGLYADAVDSHDRKTSDELKVKLELCTCKIIQLAAERRKHR